MKISNLFFSVKLTLLFISAICTTTLAKMEFQLAQLVFRHGDRNPIDLYPNDPYKNESYWPEGFSQLTKIGKLQHYKLGKWIRNRYEGFISEYSPYEVEVHSSDVDRALMSAESNLAGIFPPNDSVSLWNPKLKWQPIPVHTVDVNNDNRIKMSAPCPRYQQLEQDFMSNSDVMKNINKTYQSLFEYLTNKSGKAVKDPQEVEYLYDDLFIETKYNYTLPEWTNSVFPHKMDYLAKFSFIMNTYTDEMKRLKVGPLLKYMISHMTDKISDSGDAAKKKLVLYSGHDTTVAALLHTLNVFDLQRPPYASLVLMELYKEDSSNKYFVQVSLKNETDREPYNLTLPGCTVLCPFEDFVTLTKPMIPEDWTKECQKAIVLFDTWAVDSSAFNTILIAGFGIVLLIVLMSLLVLAFSRKISHSPEDKLKYPYVHLKMEDEEA